MAVSLVNDYIRKTGLLSRISNMNTVIWFNGITFYEIVLSFLLPLVIIVIVTFLMKKQYDNSKSKRDRAHHKSTWDIEQN